MPQVETEIGVSVRAGCSSQLWYGLGSLGSPTVECCERGHQRGGALRGVQGQLAGIAGREKSHWLGSPNASYVEGVVRGDLGGSRGDHCWCECQVNQGGKVSKMEQEVWVSRTLVAWSQQLVGPLLTLSAKFCWLDVNLFNPEPKTAG
jgi:hypothetical protein